MKNILTGSVGIRTAECKKCVICNSPGTELYRGLHDRLFSVPGNWGLQKCSNRNCGLIWLDPMPQKEDLGRLYETYYTHEIVDKPSILKRIYRRAIDAYLCKRWGYKIPSAVTQVDYFLCLLLYLNPGARAEADARVMSMYSSPGGRLLEVGFGNATTLQRMSALGWNVEGLEFDAVSVEKARAAGLNVYYGDISDQNFPDGTFDAVVSSHVLEHLPNPSQFIRECLRILKPGGIVKIYVPNSESIGHQIFRKNWLHLDVPRHLFNFNSKNLKMLLESVGFSDINVEISVRGGGALLASAYLMKHERLYPHLTGYRRLLAEVANYFSWIACKMDHELGEELVLTAKKS